MTITNLSFDQQNFAYAILFAMRGNKRGWKITANEFGAIVHKMEALFNFVATFETKEYLFKQWQIEQTDSSVTQF